MNVTETCKTDNCFVSCNMRPYGLIAAILSITASGAFVPLARPTISRIQLQESVTEVSMEPKEAVKLFGRLAEKYIMLDATGGMCCYSGCTGESPLSKSLELVAPCHVGVVLS